MPTNKITNPLPNIDQTSYKTLSSKHDITATNNHLKMQITHACQ